MCTRQNQLDTVTNVGNRGEVPEEPEDTPCFMAQAASMSFLNNALFLAACSLFLHWSRPSSHPTAFVHPISPRYTVPVSQGAQNAEPSFKGRSVTIFLRPG